MAAHSATAALWRAKPLLLLFVALACAVGLYLVSDQLVVVVTGAVYSAQRWDRRTSLSDVGARSSVRRALVTEGTKGVTTTTRRRARPLRETTTRRARRSTARPAKRRTTTSRPATTTTPDMDPLDPVWAYYDPRFDRITVTVLTKESENKPAYCHYLNANGRQVAGLRPYASRVFPLYMVHCGVGSRAPFVAISLDGNLMEPVPLADMISVMEMPSKESSRRPFAVCLAPIFGGNVMWPVLLQFVAAYTVLAPADHFYFYVRDEHERGVSVLLDHYERAGIGHRVRLPLEARGKERCVDAHRCRHNFQINDCIFRTAHRYDYVAVVDIDDLIVPGDNKRTLHQVYSESDPKGGYGAMCLQNRWVMAPGNFTTQSMFAGTSVQSKVELMPMLQHHNTSAAAPKRFVSKCMVRPEAIHYMGVHFVRTMAKGYSTLWATDDVAHVHMYRNTTDWGQKYIQRAADMGNMTTMSLCGERLERRIVDEATRTLVAALGQ